MPANDPRLEHLRDVFHVPRFERLEIEHFFSVYKDLEPGKSVEGATWTGRQEAEEEIEASYARLHDDPHAHAATAGLSVDVPDALDALDPDLPRDLERSVGDTP